MKIITENFVGKTREGLTAQDAFTEMLCQHEWDLFCTFTYREAVWASEKVEKDLNRTIRNAFAFDIGMNPKSRSFKRLYKASGGVPWLIAIEQHKLGTLHAHALVGVRSDSTGASNIRQQTQTITKEAIQEVWKSDIRNSGYTKIEQLKENSKGVNYMVKTSRYCSKNPEAILDWNGLTGWQDDAHVHLHDENIGRYESDL